MKYKCVFYARVSTKNESQKESCEHQRLLCDDYVERHPNYEIVGYYVDDGISGKNDNREQYLKMINRILEGDIDYILAKDCDRLCRSTEVNGALNKILVQTNTMVFYLGDCTFYNPFKRQDRMDFCMEQKEKCDMEITSIKEEIEKANNRNQEVDDISMKLEEIKTFLDDLKELKTIDRQFVKHMVDRITINEDGRLYITFKFSNQKLVATIKAFNEAKQAIREGLPLIHKYRTHIYKRLEEIIDFWRNVGMIRERGMMGDFQRRMEIPAVIF